MPDQDKPDFTAVNEEREKRVIRAILDFDWGNYGLGEMDSLAHDVKGEIEENGESDHMDWARDLAKAVLVAGRPLTLGELSE